MTIFCFIPLSRKDGILNPILNTINRVEYKVNESHLGNEKFFFRTGKPRQRMKFRGDTVCVAHPLLMLILGLLNVFHRVSGCLEKT